MSVRQTLIGASLFVLMGATASSLAQKTPLEELATLKAPPGMEIALFAAEPMVVNPSAIDIDAYGRVWVAEIQWYRAKAKKPPADKIKVLEDTDGDGKADKVTVFADGLLCPMSICVAGSKIYVATSPDLWVYEDKNNDLVADGPPRKLLTGFGGVNHDHGAHSLVLSADHRWHMSHGDGGFAVKGTDGKEIEYRWGAMLAGELDGSKLEIVARNFRNPYELCVNSFGEVFCSDNDNDGNQSARVCWIMPGGNYGWFGAPPPRAAPGTPLGEHWHFRGHLVGNVPATLVTGFGSPCGICFYEGNAFGAEYENVPWHCDPGPRELRVYPHRSIGYGMKAQSKVVARTQIDHYFRPVDICAAPDGSMILADWYDGGVGGHAYNDPDRGRLFSLRPSGAKRTPSTSPPTTTAEAAIALASPNLATQFLAREQFLRAGSDSVPALVKLVSSPDRNRRARALWVLDRLGGPARQHVERQLSSDDAAFRALAIRILARHEDTPWSVVASLAGDPSPIVRREVLLAAGRRRDDASLASVVALAKEYDGKDRYQLEAIVIAAGDRRARLAERIDADKGWSIDNVSLLQALDPDRASRWWRDQIAAHHQDEAAFDRVIVAAARMPDLSIGRAVVASTEDRSLSPAARKRSLDVAADQFAGNWRLLMEGDRMAPGVLRRLLSDDDLRDSALRVVARYRLRSLGGDVLKVAINDRIATSTRCLALGIAATLGAPNAIKEIRPLATSDSPELRGAATDALIELNDARTVRAILKEDAQPKDATIALVGRLMKSPAGALVLARMIDQQELPERISRETLALAGSHPDVAIRRLFESHLPPEQRPQTLGAAIKPDEILSLKGDPGKGERLFFENAALRCSFCHRVDGAGGSIGPELSQIGKKYARAALLETITQPSKAIAPEYIPYVCQTKDGDSHVGLLVERGKEKIVLRDAKNEVHAISTSDVESFTAQSKSLMPELVLQEATAQDASDLLAFLGGLTLGITPIETALALGPFDSRDEQGLTTSFEPESSLREPNREATYSGVKNARLSWAPWTARSGAEGIRFEPALLSQARQLRAQRVTFYIAVPVESGADQEGAILWRSNLACRAWLQGEEIGTIQPSPDRPKKIPVHWKKGKQWLALKVEQKNQAGDFSLLLAHQDPLRVVIDPGAK